MKLTTARLKKLIREELDRMQEVDMSKMNAMSKVSYYVPQALQALDKEYGYKGRPEREKESHRLKSVAADLGMDIKRDQITDDEAIQKLKVEFATGVNKEIIDYALKAMGKY